MSFRYRQISVRQWSRLNYNICEVRILKLFLSFFVMFMRHHRMAKQEFVCLSFVGICIHRILPKALLSFWSILYGVSVLFQGMFSDVHRTVACKAVSGSIICAIIWAWLVIREWLIMCMRIQGLRTCSCNFMMIYFIVNF